MKSRFFVTGCLLAGIVSTPGFAHGVINKGTFLIGGGAGFSRGEAVSSHDLGIDLESGVGTSLRAGWSPGENLILGIEGSAYHHVESESAVGRTDSYVAWVAAMTIFPMGTPVYVRGGIGRGKLSAETSVGSPGRISTEEGIALLFATGWEWRLSGNLAMAPQLETVIVDLDGVSVDELSFSTISIQTNWYW